MTEPMALNGSHTLKEKVERLEAENAELRRRLGLDSSNSDKPPSSDGHKKPPVKPALPKEKNGAKGGQKGHKGNTLKRVEKPDHVQTHIPVSANAAGVNSARTKRKSWAAAKYSTCRSRN